MAFEPMTARSHAVFSALLFFVLAGGATQAANQPAVLSKDPGTGQRIAQTGAVVFDHPGGFYQSAFALALSAPAEGVMIYYTTNGASPQPASAILYTQPLAINSTTIVRAAAFSQGTNLTGTAARTYLFVPDILRQTGAQFPRAWGTNRGQPVPAHYGMATASAEHAASRRAVAEALRSGATLSIVADPGDLFSWETGIYAHPLERGTAWERPVSVEMIDGEGGLAFQCGGGLRIHGGMSRHPEESPKHSFRLSFRPRYGSARLHFPVFGPGGLQEFDTLILRAGNNNSWLDSNGEGRRRADYIRDEWMRRSMLAMGCPSARGIFVHLYLNGLYWGLYNLCERPDSSLLGGDQTDPAMGFDARKADKMESGDQVTWAKMMALANSGVGDERSYQEIVKYFDLPELADYLILNFYAGNSDWDRSANWFAARPRTPGGRFRFFVWDAERTLEAADANTIDFDDDECPARLFQKLSENAKFRSFFADRVQRLCSDNGPLAPKVAAERYRALAESIQKAVPAEAARWGTYRRDVHPYKTGPYERYTCEEHWRTEVSRILNYYFPERLAFLLNQFRERGLFPATLK
jgi:hypothetical protein